eukprot:6175139-Pleurochrysis_carterae.AAC.1
MSGFDRREHSAVLAHAQAHRRQHGRTSTWAHARVRASRKSGRTARTHRARAHTKHAVCVPDSRTH